MKRLSHYFSRLAAFLSIFFCLFLNAAFSQKPKKIEKLGYLEFEGAVRKNGIGLGGAKILIVSNEGDTIRSLPESTGNFLLTLALNKEYTLVFSKPGYATRTVLVSAIVPEEEKYIVYSYKFNMEMIDTAEHIPAEFLDKPSGKIRYDTSLIDPDFDYDKSYTKKIQEELRVIRDKAKPKLNTDSIAKAQADVKREADLRAKASADSLAKAKADAKALAELKVKAKNDSIAKAKEETKLKAELEAKAKLHADSLAKALVETKAKARVDSIAKAEADAKARAEADKIKKDQEAKAKLHADSLAKALAETKAKARVDSIAKAEADAKASAETKAKARIDSITKAESDAKAKASAAQLKKDQDTRAKIHTDSLAKVESEARLKAEAEQLKKEKEQKAKAQADSIARVQADAKMKARNDSISKIESEKAKKEQEARTKARADSSAKAEEQRKKLEAESNKKQMAEIQAKKDALSNSSVADPKKSVSNLPQIDKEYPVGVTKETIKEARRTIERTIVNREDGVQYVISKVTTDWGGVFWFKNEGSISGDMYNLEIKQAKALEKKANGK